MPRTCLEVLLGLVLILGSSQPLDLPALLSQKQLLQAEMARLYLEKPTRPESQLLLNDLQLRDHQLSLQMASLEGSNSQRLAINLTADFEHLQQKLDDLKHQLERLDGRFASQGKQLEQDSAPAPAAAPSGSGLGSFLWGPLLSMPEFPQGNVANDHQNHNHQQDHQQDQQQQPGASPSIIKRVLDMLRPSVGVANLRNRWAEADKSAGLGKVAGSGKAPQAITAEELLPQLQEQRRFLDDAITRLELLAVKNKFRKS